MDRDETLRKAEKLLRQGRLDAAIAEYARLVEEQPRDWGTANLLGDLYVRAGQIDQAVAQYTRIAEHLASEGFVSKATALYKKVVKIHPDDDSALRRTAELAAQQGLTADARMHLGALFQQRLRRGDRPGAAQAASAFADIDPNDAAARVVSARMFAEIGNGAGAADQLRAAGESLLAAGKTAECVRCWHDALRHHPEDVLTRDLLVKALLDDGKPDAARDIARTAAHWRAVSGSLARAGRDAEAMAALESALDADPSDVAVRVHLARSAMARRDDAKARQVLGSLAESADPAVQFALAELEFRSGAIERGREALSRCLAARGDLVSASIDLACTMGPGAPEAGFAVIETVVAHAGASGDADLALAALERFLAVAPENVAALEALIEMCAGQTFYENQRYRAQVQLADIYLAREQWSEARDLAEQLAAARPDDAGHVQRLARAMAGAGVPDSESAARARVRRLAAPEGLADFAEFRAPTTSLAEDVSTADLGVPPVPWGLPSASRPPLALAEPPPSLESPATLVSEAAPDALDRPGLDAAGETNDAPPGLPGPDREVFEIDLSGELDDLMNVAEAAAVEAPAAPEHAGGLDAYFDALRERHGRNVEELEASQAYDRASEHFNRGETDAAAACLRNAARDPSFRFRAASMLARMARAQHRLAEAVEWLERAGEVPAPSAEAGHGLLYELGDTLDAAEEHARALAVFIELQAVRPSYRDVSERIASLSLRRGDGANARRGLS